MGIHYLNFEYYTGSQVAMNQNTAIELTGTNEVRDITDRSFIEKAIDAATEIWNKITDTSTFEVDGVAMTIKG